jgi:small subunit ribosomal protein S5
MADEKSTQKKRRGGKPTGGSPQAAPAGGDAAAAGPGGDSGNRRRRGGKNDKRDTKPREEEREELDERVVDIKRVAKVIKGGRRFAFRTTVIVGDGKGRVGIGIGKARAVPDAIRKGSDRARRNMNHVSLSGSTIPHPVIAEYGGARVMLRPATPGTGVIAGGGVRAVLEAAGVRDILSKSQGSNNLLNVTLATLEALHQLRSAEQVAAMRGKDVEDVRPFFEKKKG